MMDRQTSAALDRWITRDPPYDDGERVQLKCLACGRFLKEQEDGLREWVAVEHCSGEAKVLDCVYGAVASDEGILQIIGEEFRGTSYQIAYPPVCGSMKGSNHRTFDGDIAPEAAPKWTHEPHFFADDFGYQQVAIRVCVCGHANEEAS
jgi:hypothetical protein